jgi:hypothetical protein
MLRALVLALLLLPGGLAARVEAESAKAEGETGGEAGEAMDPGHTALPLAVAGVDYTAEVTPNDNAPADLRLRRSDGTSMADQGYAVAELGALACRELGLRFDAGLPPILAADGSWTVAGGCK